MYDYRKLSSHLRRNYYYFLLHDVASLPGGGHNSWSGMWTYPFYFEFTTTVMKRTDPVKWMWKTLINPFKYTTFKHTMEK